MIIKRIQNANTKRCELIKTEEHKNRDQLHIHVFNELTYSLSKQFHRCRYLVSYKQDLSK